MWWPTQPCLQIVIRRFSLAPPKVESENLFVVSESLEVPTCAVQSAVLTKAYYVNALSALLLPPELH